MSTINLSTVATMVIHLVGREYLLFETAVQVKLTPHSAPFNAWGACVGPKNELYVMDSDEQWHQLTETDTNAEQMISSLYQRLQMLIVRTKEVV